MSPTIGRLAAFALAAGLAGCARGPATESVTDRLAPPETAAHGPPPVRRLEAEGQLGPGKGTLVLDLAPPAGGALSEGAPVTVRAARSGMGLELPDKTRIRLEPKKLPLRIPVRVADGALSPARLDLTYYYCTKGDDASCRPERARLEVELDLSGSSEGGEAFVTYRPKDRAPRGRS